MTSLSPVPARSAHPFAEFEPLTQGDLIRILIDFLPVWICLVAVVAGSVVARWRHRRRSAFSRGLRVRLEAQRRGVSAHAIGYGGVWALPFLVWAWKALS